jgi:hypothetical protein
MRWPLLVCAVLLSACDKQVPQTIVVRADITNATLESLWLIPADRCAGDSIKAGWYQNGLWIFSLSSTRGGVDVVTQELTLCRLDDSGKPVAAWRGLHGGGAPLIVLSCPADNSRPCALYMEQHAEGSWESRE